jgi:4-amino-4-deoxy-L-arabinose transferase-like glycosyltransferase
MTQTESTLLTPSKIFILILALAAIWFGTLNYRHLLPSDEGRYAEIAREMVATNDWITPRYNDYKYFEKPPLQAWATAISFKLFGLGEWQARLWSGLTSFLTILAAGLTAGGLFGRRTGWLTSAILASSPIWILAGHFNALDMGLSAFMAFSLFSLLLGQSAPQKSFSEGFWMTLCWAFMALAVLSKGLVGLVLPGIVLIVYSISAKDWRIWIRLHWIKGLIVFFAIAAPWFILVSIQNPEFPEFFFIREHFQRFTTNEHRRGAPWFFFFPLLLIGFLPWLWQIPGGFFAALKERSSHNESENTFKPLWLCLVWAVVIFAFFSKSQSKLPGYIIPIFPALAILAAYSINESFFKQSTSGFFDKQSSHSKLWAIQTFFFGLLFLAGFWALPLISESGQAHEAQSFQRYSYWVATALTVTVVGCLLAFMFRKRSQLASILIYSSAFLAMTLIAGSGHETVGRLPSGFDLATQVKPLIKPGAPFYSVNLLDHTVPFYLQKPMTMVEFADELEFGIEQEPDKWLPSVEEFKKHWMGADEPDALAIMRPATYQEFLSQGLPMELVAQDAIRVVIKKLDPQQTAAKPKD